MDHPEPISKRPTDIPQCRKGFTLDEARQFVDQVMEVFRGLEDMSDLRSMYETGKQLSRAYFDCHAYRAELAQHLTACDYPAFASKMMKKLNNMGVFKNDDIWFSSFYFYNTTWNFSDTWPDFASALAAAGLPNLLNLNIGHQPYLENLSSKNVYYLIKASLSIIHNIARVPGNSHHFAADSVRLALTHLAQREEEFLRCVSTLCLAHIVAQPEGSDLVRSLAGYIASARVSEKRRCHGFQVIEFLSALCALSVHDSVKPMLVSSTENEGILSLLKDLVEIALLASPSAVALREAEEAIRILWNLCLVQEGQSSQQQQQQQQLKSWLADQLANPKAADQLSRSMMRALESAHWRLTHPMPNNAPTHTIDVGQILVSCAPANRILASRLAERLREANLPLANLAFSQSAATAEQQVGLSMCGAQAGSLQQWLDCVRQAPALVVCLTDAYRLSPGCRFELELYTAEERRPVLCVLLQPKLKPSGWLSRCLGNRTPIELHAKRDMDAGYDTLVAQLKEALSEARKRVEASRSVETKRHQSLAGDTGTLPGVALNHLNASSRAPSGLSVRREDTFHQGGTSTPVSTNMRSPVPTNAWRRVIRPEVREWSTSAVANWLKFRSLGHVPAHMPGGIDGVLLSQLAGLRVWAPDYFTQSLRTELGLSFADSLRFLEALDELAPAEEETKKLDPEDVLDGPAHLHAAFDSPPRT